MPTRVKNRRQNVLEKLSLSLTVYVEDLDRQVNLARAKIMKFFLANKVKPDLSVDYFQWRIDRGLWTAIEDKWPFPHSEPDPRGDPISLEYKDAYERCYGKYGVPASEPPQAYGSVAGTSSVLSAQNETSQWGQAEQQLSQPNLSIEVPDFTKLNLGSNDSHEYGSPPRRSRGSPAYSEYSTYSTYSGYEKFSGYEEDEEYAAPPTTGSPPYPVSFDTMMGRFGSAGFDPAPLRSSTSVAKSSTSSTRAVLPPSSKPNAATGGLLPLATAKAALKTAQPNKAAQPAKPTQPTQPTQPAMPTQPAETTQRAQPAKPAQPAKQAQPAQPAKPAQPAQRPQAELPADPTLSEQPSSSVQDTTGKRYTWPTEQAKSVFLSLYGEELKYNHCTFFEIPFPPRRSLNECVVKDISKAVHTFNEHLIGLVWKRVDATKDTPAFWKLMLTPANSHVNVKDVVFQLALSSAWGKLRDWVAELIGQKKNVNLASYLEDDIRSNIQPMRELGSLEAHQGVVDDYNDYLYDQFEAIMTNERQKVSFLAKRTSEAEAYVRRMLLAGATAQDRIQSVNQWITDEAANIHVGERRKLVKKVWEEVHDQTKDSKATIDSWFWSQMKMTEPVPPQVPVPPRGKSSHGS